MEQVISKYKTTYSNVVTKKELINELKRCSAKGYSNKTKNELIDMLEKHKHTDNDCSVFDNMMYRWYIKHEKALLTLEENLSTQSEVANKNAQDDGLTKNVQDNAQDDGSTENVQGNAEDDNRLYDKDILTFAEVLYDSDVVLNKNRVMNKRIKKADKIKLWDVVSTELETKKESMINNRVVQLRCLSILNLVANMKKYDFNPVSNRLKLGFVEYEDYCKKRDERFSKCLENMKIVVYSQDANGVFKKNEEFSD